jgi:uncharacterized membrane protein
MSAEEMFFYFTIYAWAGWLLEIGYHWVITGELGKDGFLKGPFKPMYGTTPVLLLGIVQPEVHWSLVLILCLLIPTIVEYISGDLLKRLFHRQWWDYSKHRFQIHGHICLSFSLCWLVLSLGVLYGIQPLFHTAYLMIAPLWSLMWPTVAIYFATDLAWTIRSRRRAAEQTWS